jgi:glycerol-3-phosphate O-acyltransferase
MNVWVDPYMVVTPVDALVDYLCTLSEAPSGSVTHEASVGFRWPSEMVQAVVRDVAAAEGVSMNTLVPDRGSDALPFLHQAALTHPWPTFQHSWGGTHSVDVRRALTHLMGALRPAGSTIMQANPPQRLWQLIAGNQAPPRPMEPSYWWRDIAWAFGGDHIPDPAGQARRLRPPAEALRAVMADEEVLAAIAASADPAAARRQAEAAARSMFADYRPTAARFLGYFMRKVFRTLYTHIAVDRDGIEALRRATVEHGVWLLPSHRSYADFLLLSYVCFDAGIPLPLIAAGQDFLAIVLVNHLLRWCGAFFIRRSFRSDALYWSIFAAYSRLLVDDDEVVEFFVEGTRSRTGKTLLPKAGLLGVMVDRVVARTRLEEGGGGGARSRRRSLIFPVSLAYDRILEADLHASEQLGIPKPPESLSKLFAASSVLSSSYGRVTISFGERLDVADQVRAGDEVHDVARTLSRLVAVELNKATPATSTALVAGAVLAGRGPVPEADLVDRVAVVGAMVEDAGADLVPRDGPHATVRAGTTLLASNALDSSVSKGVTHYFLHADGRHASLVLAMYRNSLTWHLFGPALLVLAASLHLPGAHLDADELVHEAAWLADLLRVEFVFATAVYPTDELVTRALPLLQRWSVLTPAATPQGERLCLRQGSVETSLLFSLLRPYGVALLAGAQLLRTHGPNVTPRVLSTFVSALIGTGRAVDEEAASLDTGKNVLRVLRERTDLHRVEEVLGALTRPRARL